MLRRFLSTAIAIATTTTTATAPAMPTSSLANAVGQALARNPTAQIAKANVARAEALVIQARSTFLPIVTGNAIYTRIDAEREFNGRVVAAANSFNVNALVSVPIIAPRGWVQFSHAKEA